MNAKTLMILGTSSSVGKSLLVAALCRIYARRGRRVLPFKAQNMSNNAAVCSGGEIGRAQAVQAYAAGVEAQVDMNPILLKPEADHRSQVIVHGRVWQTFAAGDYYPQKAVLWQAVTASLDRLRSQADLVILEGAGSPVELNLKAGDLVNMAAARYAAAPVLLAGDIDRGGVFAQLLGTLWLLEPEERALVKGLLVNKFRGDARLFDDGLRILRERGGVPVLGLIPYLHEHGIAEEDAVTVEESRPLAAPAAVDIAVIRLPRISNFDDFDPLALEPGVRLRYVGSPAELGQPQAILLPGTKSTLADLAWLHEQGLAAAICAHARRGAVVVGICGGFQMLGEQVLDPQRVESSQETLPGLGLLPVTTIFQGLKATYRSQARICGGGGFWQALRGQAIGGYEIHMGETRQQGTALLEIFEREGRHVEVADGASSPDGRIFGCYLHGLFDNDAWRRAWLESLGVSGAVQDFRQRRAAAFDRLADAVQAAIDLPRLDAIIDEGV